jgi:hypothetical protein
MSWVLPILGASCARLGWGRAEARPHRGRAAWGAMSGGPDFGSRIAERNRDKTRCLRRFHPHQHCLPALGLRIGYRFAHIGGGRHGLAVDVEDDVAGLDAVAGGADLFNDLFFNLKPKWQLPFGLMLSARLSPRSMTAP